LNDYFFDSDKVIDAVDKKLVSSLIAKYGLLKLKLLFLAFHNCFEAQNFFFLPLTENNLIFQLFDIFFATLPTIGG